MKKRYGLALVTLLLSFIILHSPTFAGSKIIGGVEAQKGAYPWVAALVRGDCSGDNWECQFCGGALIDENWVITAAHCVTDETGTISQPEAINVVLGSHNLKSDDIKRTKVKQIIVNSAYNAKTYDSDIALLELETSSNQSVVQLVDGTTIEGQTAKVIGWGNMSTTGDDYPYVLQEVAVPIITNSSCNEAYNNFGYINPITANMFCAGYEQGGKDSCQGDSGGPIFISVDNVWQLVGVVSWGDECAKEGLYGVYTRISQFKSFINSYVSFVDATPPTVSTTNPSNGATYVSIKTTISASFSESMDDSTITGTNFTVGLSATKRGRAITTTLAGTVTYDSQSRTATFTPSADLTTNSTYSATISNGVKDSAGNAMVQAYTWTFTTGTSTDINYNGSGDDGNSTCFINLLK